MNLKIKADKIQAHYVNIPHSNLLQSLLKNLGFDENEAVRFLNSHLMDFEDPMNIFGMKEAAEYIESMISENKKIVIHGDFDVDGISATTILFDYLYYQRGVDTLPLIPHRVDEGYGLSEKTITKALDWGADLIITVDCGIKDVVLVDKYKDKVNFVITDHHQFYTEENGDIKLPDAKAVVHSAHPDSKFSCMISGGATAWQLVRAIELVRENKPNAVVDEKAFLRKGLANEAGDFSSETYLDLVAMSTVCDIIPLTIENRKFVQKGCKKISKSNRMGLVELMKVSGINPEKVDAFHFGFVLGPRLNAAARVTNDAMDAVRLLSTKKLSQAKGLAAHLDGLNVLRKSLTQQYIELAEKQIDPAKKAIVVLGEKWPEGILGLVAGRLAEKYYKPTFVASVGEKDHITGSARSPLSSFYLNKALEHAKESLLRFGGHKQAAGFASNKEIFSNFESKVLEYIEGATSDSDYEKVLEIDLVLESLNEISIEDVEELSLLEPFGMGNSKPMFLFKNCVVKNFKKLGSESTHLKLNLEFDGKDLEGIGFNMAAEYENLHVGQQVDIAGHLSINEWNNTKKIQVEVKYVLYN